MSEQYIRLAHRNDVVVKNTGVDCLRVLLHKEALFGRQSMASGNRLARLFGLTGWIFAGTNRVTLKNIFAINK